MSDFKETAVLLVSKEHLAFMKDDKGFKEYIVKRLSSELGNRIMGILEREEEIILRRSDLRVREHMPTNSVEYRRQINWNPLVRCKDCKWWDKYSEKRGYCMAAKHGFMSSHWEIGIYRIYDEDFFCADAEPKEKEGGDNEKAD